MAGRRLEKLLASRPALLVSLPRNDLALAEAALEAGADGLKVHLNVHHHASGTHFGSWTEEREAIEATLALGAPVGIVPGTRECMITPGEAEALESAGVDFVDAYLQDMPDWLPEQAREMSVMAALGWTDAAGGWDLGPLQGRCSLLEASVVPPDGYGAPLQAEDLVAYAAIARRHPGLPALVPTQRALEPHQVAEVLATGMRGILIGAIVTGRTPESLARATGHFAAAVRG